MSDSIQMPGLVFMKYVRVNKSGVHIFVTHSAKSYEETPSLLFNPLSDKINYSESVNRADSDVQYTGSWVEVKGSKFLTDNDATTPMWLQTGFPIFNKQFHNTVLRKETDRYGNETKIYKVTSANLNNKEQEELLKRFRTKYPNYYGKIVENYKAKVAKGEFRSLAQRISDFKNRKPGSKEENLFEVLTGNSELPFTLQSVNRARIRQLQDWCLELGMEYKDFGSTKAVRAALKEML